MAVVVIILAALPSTGRPTAEAATGDRITLINIFQPGGVGDESKKATCAQPGDPTASNQGVGIAVVVHDNGTPDIKADDATYFWFSCIRTGAGPDLYQARLVRPGDPASSIPSVGAAEVVASFRIADPAGVNGGGGLGALAWDASREKLWAGWGAQAQNSGAVYLITCTPATGPAATCTGKEQFNVYDGAKKDGAMRNCPDTIDGDGDVGDGLAYDGSDDTLYISPSCLPNASGQFSIHQFKAADGAHLGHFERATKSQDVIDCSAFHNSGLAVGGRLLFEASAGCNRIFAVDKLGDHALIRDFVSGAAGVSEADLECDDETFGLKGLSVVWSIDRSDARRAAAFEVPPGTCATGGGPDSDGDGLPDQWERSRVTIDPDGAAGPLPPQSIELKEMGADPFKRDVFVQIDWMDCTVAGGDCKSAHDPHLPSCEALRLVVAAFWARGINLHVDAGPSGILNPSAATQCGAWPTNLRKSRALRHDNDLGATTSDGTAGTANQLYNWGEFDGLRNNFPTREQSFNATGRGPIFHYFIYAHEHGGSKSTGQSRGIGASDGIVSHNVIKALANYSDDVIEEAGTFMHELGHHFGLRHGGDQVVPVPPDDPYVIDGRAVRRDVNYKPNYLSVMNYSYQLDGLRFVTTTNNGPAYCRNVTLGTSVYTLCVDYSGALLTTVYEAPIRDAQGAIDPARSTTEQASIGQTTYAIRKYCQAFGQYVPYSRNLSNGVDWDCDGGQPESGFVGARVDPNVGPDPGTDVNGDPCVLSGADGGLASTAVAQDLRAPDAAIRDKDRQCDSEAATGDLQWRPRGTEEVRELRGHDDWANIKLLAPRSAVAAAGADSPMTTLAETPIGAEYPAPDTQAPVTQATISGGTQGNNGWYLVSPTITLTVSDDRPPHHLVEIYYQFANRVPSPLQAASPEQGGWTRYTTALSPPGGDTVLYASAIDLSENVESTRDLGRFKVDATRPSITITSPVANAIYLLHESVDADYECSDGGSGVASCLGPVADGEDIDTSATGTKTFNVVAADNAGNTATQSVTYQVVPDDFFASPVEEPPATNTAQAGKVVPVKFRLSSNQGANPFANGYPQSQKIDCGSRKPTGDPPSATIGTTEQTTVAEYTYAWKTDSGWGGSCRRLIVKLKGGSERLVHVADFQFTK